ncbi:hypothetical protein M378DRAFT_8150 [Amanita muscaria Koide BX008]|uniref:Ribonuclease H1 N-terminal domain-containing protein n=1 Tax=Amanita muscaria (strain Koide BX008) TaxID=946122 RepID=A0A0C2SYS1_AMAMK|nr:hypothetical protein M378DRAFT_8150 [Amanita muscaria Koide BX008]
MFTPLDKVTQKSQMDPRPALYSQQTKAPTVMERGPPPIPYHTRPNLTPIETVKTSIALEKTSNQQSEGNHLASTRSVMHRNTSTVGAEYTVPAARVPSRSRPPTVISLNAEPMPSAPSSRPLIGKGEVSIRLTETTGARSHSRVVLDAKIPLPSREFVQAKGHVGSQSSRPTSRLLHSSTMTPSSTNDMEDPDDLVYWVEQSVQRLKLEDHAENFSHAQRNVQTSTHGTTAPACSTYKKRVTFASTPTGYALWPSDSEVSEDDQETKTKKYYVIAQGRRPGVYETWREAEPLVTGVKNNLHKSYVGKKKAFRMYKKCHERGIVKVRQ